MLQRFVEEAGVLGHFVFFEFSQAGLTNIDLTLKSERSRFTDFPNYTTDGRHCRDDPLEKLGVKLRLRHITARKLRDFADQFLNMLFGLLDHIGGE